MSAYIPKPIRGQSVPGYIKVSRAQVAKIFASGGKFHGFIVGNKVHSFHFFGGWHLAFPIHVEDVEIFNHRLVDWAYFNANSETGKTPAIYIKKP